MRRGWTLIESLVAVAIITLVLVIIIAAFSATGTLTDQSHAYDFMSGTHVSIVKLDGHDYVVNSKGGMIHSFSCQHKDK